MSFLSSFKDSFKTKNSFKNNALAAYAAHQGLKFYKPSEFGGDQTSVEQRQEMLSILTKKGKKSFKKFGDLTDTHVFSDCDEASEYKKELQKALIYLFTYDDEIKKIVEEREIKKTVEEREIKKTVEEREKLLTNSQKEILNMVTMIGTQAVKKNGENKYEAPYIKHSKATGACVMYSKFTGNPYTKEYSENIKMMEAALNAIKSIINNRGADEDKEFKDYLQKENVSKNLNVHITACDDALTACANANTALTKINKDALNKILKEETKSTQGGRKSKKARKGRKGRRTKNKRKRQTKKKRGKKRH